MHDGVSKLFPSLFSYATGPNLKFPFGVGVGASLSYRHRAAVLAHATSSRGGDCGDVNASIPPMQSSVVVGVRALGTWKMGLKVFYIVQPGLLYLTQFTRVVVVDKI